MASLWDMKQTQARLRWWETRAQGLIILPSGLSGPSGTWGPCRRWCQEPGLSIETELFHVQSPPQTSLLWLQGQSRHYPPRYPPRQLHLHVRATSPPIPTGTPCQLSHRHRHILISTVILSETRALCGQLNLRRKYLPIPLILRQKLSARKSALVSRFFKS